MIPRRLVLVLALSLNLATGLLINNSQATIPNSTLVKLKIPSPERDFPIRTVYVWTPAVPVDQITVLPVVYMLHGWPGSPSGLMSAVIPQLTKAFAGGSAPFIAVFPDGNSISHPDSEWADSYDGRAKIETWLTTNVIDKVEAGNIRSKDNRAILGFSMGGYGAASIGMHHPNLYGQIISLAGYFVVDDDTNVFGNKSSQIAKIAYQSPTNFAVVANQFRWFLGESHQDYTPLIRGQSVAWAKKLKGVNASYTLSSASGGHSYTFVANEIPIVTKWLKWSAVPAVTPSPEPPIETLTATQTPTVLTSP